MKVFEEKLKDAIACNDIEFLEKYKDHYNINHRFSDEDNDSLLSYAISNKDSDAYKFFLDNGADITLVNNEGEGIIHSIIFSGSLHRLIYMLGQYPKLLNFINIQSNDGSTPLLLSIALEKYEIANYLIDIGTDINIADNDGNLPIHMACYFGNKSLVSKLIEEGTDLHKKTNKGNYPFALAVNEDHHDLVKYLYMIIYQKVTHG